MQGARCRVQGARCKVQCARCTVQGARCKVHGARCSVDESSSGYLKALGRFWSFRGLLWLPRASWSVLALPMPSPAPQEPSGCLVASVQPGSLPAIVLVRRMRLLLGFCPPGSLSSPSFALGALSSSAMRGLARVGQAGMCQAAISVCAPCLKSTNRAH